MVCTLYRCIIYYDITKNVLEKHDTLLTLSIAMYSGNTIFLLLNVV